MKHFALVVVFLAPVAVIGQQGTVLYEEVVRIDIELPPEMQHMRDRIPREQTTRHQLLFDGSRSLMRIAPEETEPTQLEAESRGFRFRMMQAQAENETFADHDAGTLIERRDFLGRTFLINGSAGDLAWRLTGEQAEFKGMLTMKAMALTSDSTKVEAWFTPEVPAPVGPGRYGGLPGLIVVLTEDDGRRTYVAKEITLDEIGDIAIAAPTRGREVTQEEFEAIVEERMREMGAQRGRRGVIRFQN